MTTALESPRLYNLTEVSTRTGGLGRHFLTGEINRGRLRSIFIGRGHKIPAEWLQEYIDLLKRERASRPTRPEPIRRRASMTPS